MIKQKHLKKTIKHDYRMIVVSDIHGHLDRFKSLLKKVQYTPDDYLIILGDFVEKGDQVIETIHYVKELAQNERTYVLAGNCEWAMCALLEIPELALEIPRYFQRVSANGAIRTVYHRLHLDDGRETPLGIQKQIAQYLKEELRFISTLPTTLKINQFLFVHAGIENRLDYQNSSMSSLLEMQNFYKQGHPLDEMVIVGHLPTSNYDERYIDNNIIIDEEKRIICIDGGTGVKQVSQLNALIIESKDQHITYTTKHVQPLPYVEVKNDIVGHNTSIHKIAFPFFEVEIIEKKECFSLCKQIETNLIFDIKNEFIYQRNNKYYCMDDYTNRMLSISKGEKVKIIGIYDIYSYVIYKKQVGWVKTEDLCI